MDHHFLQIIGDQTRHFSSKTIRQHDFGKNSNEMSHIMETLSANVPRALEKASHA